MENRLKAYEPAKISEDFSSYLLCSRLNLFQGPQDIERLVSDFIKDKEEKARKEGAEEAVKSIITAIRQGIDNYIALITKIVDFVYDAASKKLGSVDFKIEEIRTNFCFETKAINILFIIDANFDNEFSLSFLLNEVEKTVLQREGFVADMLYINKKNVELDYNSINSDYPYVRNLEKKS